MTTKRWAKAAEVAAGLFAEATEGRPRSTEEKIRNLLAGVHAWARANGVSYTMLWTDAGRKYRKQARREGREELTDAPD